MGKKKTEETIVTFTVAECGEYYNLGEYHEGIRTLGEAVRLYQQIPPEHMNGIPSIGINLHVVGTEKMEDSQADILSGGDMPEFSRNPQVQAAIKEIIGLFPDKEVIDY